MSAQVWHNTHAESWRDLIVHERLHSLYEKRPGAHKIDYETVRAHSTEGLIGRSWMSETTVTILNQENRKVVYTKTVHYCPHCGQQQVWGDDSDDYYVGCDYLCLACKYRFWMPLLVEDAQHVIILELALGPAPPSA